MTYGVHCTYIIHTLYIIHTYTHTHILVHKRLKALMWRRPYLATSLVSTSHAAAAVCAMLELPFLQMTSFRRPQFRPCYYLLGFAF